MIQYIAIASIGISLVYALYRLFFQEDTNFRQIRFFLQTGVVLSLLLPLSSAKLDLSFLKEKEVGADFVFVANNVVQADVSTKVSFDWFGWAVKIYGAISLFFICKILWQLIVLTYIGSKSRRIRRGGAVLVINNYFSSNFTFLKWIFVTEDSWQDNDFEIIFAHEYAHAQQYHSLDILILEFIMAVMWINPWGWKLRKTFQLVHEYLADEGALSTGVGRYEYQALLINQVAEERLIRLSSNFNHSLIKKRMIMITKSKTNRSTKLKNLMLLPFAMFLFLVVVGVNTSLAQDKKTKIEDNDASVELYTVDKDGSVYVSCSETGKTGKKRKRVYIVNKETDGKQNLLSKTDTRVTVTHKGDDKEKVTIRANKNTSLNVYSHENVLYIIDGKETMDEKELRNLSTDKIESINVIKGKKQVKIGTDKDVDTVINISTK